ncbi:hypothetical protein ACE38V_01115 [Cytobacillus sp. Hz8]|uniref:hypothetical protein n=1 Tax=Cytobacillus sp. Hz8 TaxID=3347168 RepID=UPI0035DF57A0
MKILDSNAKYHCNDANNFAISRALMGTFGARNLLPAPVENTSQNTMKITYDFIFDAVNPW